jgi:hypothetical protein
MTSRSPEPTRANAARRRGSPPLSRSLRVTLIPEVLLERGAHGLVLRRQPVRIFRQVVSTPSRQSSGTRRRTSCASALPSREALPGRSVAPGGYRSSSCREAVASRPATARDPCRPRSRKASSMVGAIPRCAPGVCAWRPAGRQDRAQGGAGTRTPLRRTTSVSGGATMKSVREGSNTRRQIKVPDNRRRSELLGTCVLLCKNFFA